MKRHSLVLVFVVLALLVGCKEHEDYWKLVDETAPTCTEAGGKRYVCISCGAQKTDVVPALGHVSDNDYDYVYDNGKLYTQTHCTVCGQSLEPVLMDEGSYVIVTPETKVQNYTKSNIVYYFTEGEYGDMTGNYALWYRKGENITFVGDKKASFNNLGIGYHGNHDKDNPAKENSTLTVKGFNVVGTLTVNTIDRNVVIEDNACGSIAVYPCKTTDMVVSVRNNVFDGSKSGSSYKYNLYVVPEVSGYTLNVTGNDFANASSHCIGIQGNGQGSATTAAKEFVVSDNVFKSFGTDGKDGRAAFKIWADTTWAPAAGAAMSADAIALMEGIIANNTFECTIDGTKLVYGNFYDVAYMPKN